MAGVPRVPGKKEGRLGLARVLGGAPRVPTPSDAQVWHIHATELRAALGLRACALFRVIHGTGERVLLAASGEDVCLFQGPRALPGSADLMALAAGARRPLFSADLSADPRLTLAPEAQSGLRGTPLRAMLAVPLVRREQVIGMVAGLAPAGTELGEASLHEVRHRLERVALWLVRLQVLEDLRLSHQQFDALVAANRYLLTATERKYARLTRVDATRRKALQAERDAAQRLAARLKALNELAAVFGSSLDPQRVFDFVAEAASRLLDGAVAALRVWDEGAETLRLRADHGIDGSGPPPPGAVAPSEGLVGWIFRRRQTLFVADALEDPRMANRAWAEARDLRAFVGVPLLLRDRCLGVLSAWRARGKPFRRLDADLLEALAAHASTAIEHANQYGRISAEWERLRVLLETMPAGVVVEEGSPDGGGFRPIMANRALGQLLRTRTPALGARTPDFEILHPDGTPLHDHELPLRRAILHGETLYDLELAVRFPDGSQRSVLCSAQPLSEVAGFRQAIAVFQDITERKRAEEELKRLAAEVTGLYERAAQEAEVKGLLLQELTHRVRNNLDTVVSLLDLQLEKAEGRREAPALEEAAARVRALAIVQNLLLGSPEEAGDYGSLARRLAERVLVQGPLAGRVAVRVEGSPLRLPSKHLTALGLITNELFVNVAKHAFPGGRRGTVEVWVEAAGPEVTIRVRDDGVGMPPRAAAGTDGSGHIGLRLIRSLAEASLGGSFALETRGGTTAVVRFPRPEVPDPATVGRRE